MFLQKIYGRSGLRNTEIREDWLKSVIQKIPDGETILDAGAGETRYKKYCSHLEYTSQDFGEYNGGGEEGLQAENWDNSSLDIISDIIDIPVDDNSFDNIMCVEVFEHLPDARLAIKEFSRILKPGGRLITTAPFCSLTHMAPYYFVTGFSKYFYEKFLPENGFEIKEIFYNGNYFEYLAQEIHRINTMGKKYSKIGFFTSLFIKIFSFPLLFLLNRLSKGNNKSEEVLCFDLQVVAIKNRI